MTPTANINPLTAVPEDTMLQENIVSNAISPSIGIQFPKDVLFASQDTPGIQEPTNAHAVNYQEPLSTEYAHANTLNLNGSQAANDAFVHQTLSETTVYHAHHQEFGTGMPTPVHAQHHWQSGIHLQENVNVQQEDTDHTVLNAHHQDTGISPIKTVSVLAHWYGTETTVYAHNHTSHTKEDALNAQTDLNGPTIPVKNATAAISHLKL